MRVSGKYHDGIVMSSGKYRYFWHVMHWAKCMTINMIKYLFYAGTKIDLEHLLDKRSGSEDNGKEWQ